MIFLEYMMQISSAKSLVINTSHGSAQLNEQLKDELEINECNNIKIHTIIPIINLSG